MRRVGDVHDAQPLSGDVGVGPRDRHVLGIRRVAGADLGGVRRVGDVHDAQAAQIGDVGVGPRNRHAIGIPRRVVGAGLGRVRRVGDGDDAQAAALSGDVGIGPRDRHVPHHTGQNTRLANDGGLGRVGDVQDDQPGSYADVGIVPLQGHRIYPAADLAYQFHVPRLWLERRPLLQPRQRPPSQDVSSAWVRVVGGVGDRGGGAGELSGSGGKGRKGKI